MLSGALVAAVGPALSLLMDAGTFLTSYLLIRAARWEPAPRDEHRGNPLSEALGGVRWARSDPLGRTVLGAEALHALGAGFFLSALAPFVRELGGGAALYGAQGGVFGVGLLISSWLLGRASICGAGALYAGGMVLGGFGNLLLGLAPFPAWLLPAVLVAGLGFPPWTAGRQSLLQAHVPQRVLGRVLALLDTLGAVMVLPAFVVGGWMVDRVGARAVVAGAPLLHVGIGLYLLHSRRVRTASLDSRADG